MKQKSKPCDFDHNGECFICDCWPSDCAWNRLLNQDYEFESREELLKMFKNYMRDHNLEELIKND